MLMSISSGNGRVRRKLGKRFHLQFLVMARLLGVVLFPFALIECIQFSLVLHFSSLYFG